MADFEYQCKACLNLVKIERSIDDSLSRAPYCETCMIPMVRVLITLPIQFKGQQFGGSSQ